MALAASTLAGLDQPTARRELASLAAVALPEPARWLSLSAPYAFSAVTELGASLSLWIGSLVIARVG